MASIVENGTAPDRHIALMIDADNVSHTKIAAILTEITRYGTANIRRAYGDWSTTALKGWKDKLHEYAVRPIQQFAYSSGKNATDIALVIDTLELLYTQRLDAVCIASSDGDFTPLVMHLRAAGKAVYGFGKANTPAAFQNACTTFIFLEKLGDPDEIEQSDSSPTKATKQASKPKEPVKPAKVLAQDAKLVETLRGAVKASVGEEGWARLSAAGSAAKRLASIDPQNYGVSNFAKLFEATGLFEIVKGNSGQPWIADRKNANRSATPQE